MRTRQEILRDENPFIFFIQCKTSFKKFAERILGLEIQDFHLEWIKAINEHDRVSILAPTGFGKTTILGVAYSLWMVWRSKNKKILIVSSSMPQSTKILVEIKQRIEDNEILKELIPKKESWTRTEIETTTRCQIFCRPYTINIKGFHVDYVLADEASSFVDYKIYYDYVVTRATAKNGTVVAISTPEHIADLMGQLGANPEYWSKIYPAIKEDGTALWPKFGLEWLERRRKEIGDSAFQREYMCNSKAPSENAIFLPGDITECYDYVRKFEMKTKEITIIGCDFAIASGPRADFDAYIVIERFGDKVIIIHGETHKGMPIAAKAIRLEQLNQIFKPMKFIMDESSVGAAIIEKMREKGISVEGADFSAARRDKMLVDLKELIESKRLIIPRDPSDALTMSFTTRLSEELVKFAAVKSETTRRVSYQSTGAHDDTVMALALACKGITSQKKYIDFIAVG